MLILSAMRLPVQVLVIASYLGTLSAATTIKNSNPLIFYHGRWDESPGTWWAGSGFKLNVKNLKSMTLNLGVHTTQPLASIGVSVDYGEFNTVNVSAGANSIPLSDFVSGKNQQTVVRVNAEGWQNNRINLESIILNKGAELLPYRPSNIAFQFIGDSLSAGQFLDKGVDQAWPFLVGEAFKAEHVICAQPGAALTDIFSYGNVHGVSYQFFRTEDTGYYYTADHNFTTSWNFAKDRPTPTHLVIHIGANDASQNVTASQFVQVYESFIARLRTVYHNQPIFVFTPWGWPSSDGSISQYYQGQYQEIVDSRHKQGDHAVFLVDTTGWVQFADVFPDNVHPNVAGHQKIAKEFQSWLEGWGLRPNAHWPVMV
ncbi:SGNH-hydro domain-containing protein [Mycena indigotica]|uniref:SGNH-hydro domain-containing protein n=1 Tax=Mycena indigotica TaxID=2126181 RepID=A0A8H6W3H9_9AGAR|nr:SGNH-hydro domain-containing protein [Mycena indigotica]KAF7301591.1 SGNH-hydro domain-containing protein [Mycena indigotica]